MRRLTVVFAAALLCAAPAYAQMGGGGMGGGGGMAKGGKMGKGQPDEKKDTRTAEQKKKEENAYKDAVRSIPDGKFDPWGKVR
jgi:Spy/CpxP family protein refolding chaperone